MQKPKFTSVLRTLVSLSLLGALLWLTRENFSKIWKLLSSINKTGFVLAFLLFICSVNFLAWRLKIVLSTQGVNLTIRDLFSLTLIGHFFTNFMPTTVGGDLVKGHFISQKIKSRISSYTSILIDRLMGMFSLVLIASVALLAMGGDIEHPFVFWAVGLLFLFCIVFTLLLFNKKLQEKISNYLRLVRLLRSLKFDSLIKKVFATLDTYINNKKKITQIFAFSVFAQFISFLGVYILSDSLAIYIPFAKVILIMPIIVALCMLPITMNGLGLREWAFVFFFSPNVGSAAALSLSLLYLAMFLLTSLLGGIVYLFWR